MDVDIKQIANQYNRNHMLEQYQEIAKALTYCKKMHHPSKPTYKPVLSQNQIELLEGTVQYMIEILQEGDSGLDT